MDVENLAKELILKNMTPEQQIAVLDSVKESVAKAKEIQKRKIGENVDLVVQALKKIEEDIRSRYDDIGNSIEKRVASIKDGRDGIDGRDGKDGKDGKQGKDGRPGRDGKDGKDGLNGADGQDGVSVVNAHIDFDGSLVIHLSSGKEINVGEVVAPDLAEKIKVITNGGGTSQSVLDTLASLQSQIDNLIPSQTGNSGKYLTTNGSVLSWGTVSGGGASVSVGTSPPASPTAGDLWWSSEEGKLKIYYNDGTSTQWVDAATGTIGPTGATGATGADGPNNITTSTTTNITGLLKGNGSNVLSATSGTDYSLGTSALGTGIIKSTTGTGALTIAVAGDFPTLNQNTTGSAATLTTGRTISATGDISYTSGSFDGSANVTGAATLATVNTNVGTFTNATLTVNGKGLITSASSGTAPVTSVTGTSPVASSGGTTPAISLSSGYGDTQNPYASKTANFFLAAPNGTSGAPTFRAVVAGDIPTLNQNTTGSAASLSISGQTGLLTFTGLTSTNRAKTVRDAADTILELGGSYTPTGTWTSLTMVTPVLGTPTSGALTNCTADGTNKVGYRNVPISGSAKNTSYTLLTTDVGKYIELTTGGSITVPDATFATGDIVSIFNNTSGAITLTMSITTAYIGGTDADKATISLATRGVATILFISSTVCVVNGNVS